MKGTFKVGTRVQSEERRYEHTKLPVSPTNFHLPFKLLTRCSPLLHIRMNCVGSL